MDKTDSFDLFKALDAYLENQPPIDNWEPLESLREIILLLEMLEDDISPILNMDIAAQSASQRRSVIRAVFGLIEGLTYRMKQLALEYDDILDRNLETQERMAIMEQAIRIDDRGELRLHKEYPSVTNNVRFAFKMLKRATCSKHELEVSTDGWEAFKKSISVRDRITHPKNASDLEVTDAEIMSLRKANLWFHRSLLTAFLLSAQEMLKKKHSTIAAAPQAPASDMPPPGEELAD